MKLPKPRPFRTALAAGVIAGLAACSSQPKADNVPPPPTPDLPDDEDPGTRADEPVVPPADRDEALAPPPEGDDVGDPDR